VFHQAGAPGAQAIDLVSHAFNRDIPESRSATINMYCAVELAIVPVKREWFATIMYHNVAMIHIVMTRAIEGIESLGLGRRSPISSQDGLHAASVDICVGKYHARTAARGLLLR
jgi:hypothetical protein